MCDLVVWLRRDLRVLDNPAMHAALENHKSGICAIVLLDPRQLLTSDRSVSQRRAFIASVIACQQSFARRGIVLSILWGEAETLIPLVLEKTHARKLIFARDVTPYAKSRDTAVWHAATKLGAEVTVVRERTISLREQAGPVAASGKAVYQVFTPFYRRWQTLQRRPCVPQLTRQNAESFRTLPPSLEAHQFNPLSLPTDLMPTEQEIVNYSETEALRRLGSFLRGPVTAYAEARDSLTSDGSSRLSYALRSGTLSALWVDRVCTRLTERRIECDSFRRQLAWRDFYYHLLDARIDSATEPLRTAMRGFPYHATPAIRTAFSTGCTGFPLIDAAIRQLLAEGFMPNRLRMLVASVATKQLGIDWRLGERFFAKWLIDYDQPLNVGGWQWSASAGTDAQPYFRMFDPISQGKRYDPEGIYSLRYIPELIGVPKRYLHCPWEMPRALQEELGIVIGQHYPFPVVDLKESRVAVLAQFRDWFEIARTF